MFREVEERLAERLRRATGAGVGLRESGEKPFILLRRGGVRLEADRSVVEEETEETEEEVIDAGGGRSLELRHRPIEGSVKILGDVHGYRVVGRRVVLAKPVEGEVRVRYRYVRAVSRARTVHYEMRYILRVEAGGEELATLVERIIAELLLGDMDVDVELVKLSADDSMAVIKINVRGSWRVSKEEKGVIREIKLSGEVVEEG